MTSVWKRLQRVNKRAAKFQFTASYHRVDVETTSKWKPNKLSVVWSRRSRRVVSEPLDWEPSMKEPLKGSVIWAVPDNQTIAVTLFRDQRTNELEDKDWIFILEDVSSSGRRRRIAQTAINLRPLASAGPSQQCLSLQMRPSTTKVTSASMEVTISSVLLREGSAADEDMQSMASMMSVNNNSDIAPLDDFEEDDCSLSDNSASMRQMLDLTQQMELMTSSLAGTPGSIASLDSTPTASTPLDPLKFPSSADRYSSASSESAMKPRSIFEPISFTATKHHLSKKNLKPLELKTNLNDFAYSENIEESNSNVTTPVVETDKENDKTPIVNDGSRAPLSRESSREDSSGREPAVALDLLQWCRQVTEEYPQCKVENLGSSWTNGVAFCAIIHHFRPNLIDMAIIDPNDADTNIRIALKASEALGVPGVFHASELRRARGPDRLALITYLHQLRALFTHRQYRLDKIGPTSEESSYTIGRFNTDKDTDISVELFSQEILTMRQKKMEAQPATNRTSLSSQGSVDSQHSQDRASTVTKQISSPDKVSSADATFQKEKSPVNAMKDMILASSKNIFGKVLSPTKDKLASLNLKSPFEKFTMNKDTGDAVTKNAPVREDSKEKKETTPSDVTAKNTMSLQPTMGVTVREAWPVKLMTRKQLTDPFGSDEEDEDTQDVLTVHVDDSKSKQPTLEMNEQKILEIKGDEISHPLAPNDRESTPLSPLECLPKPTQQLLSRHDDLKVRARQLLEATRREAREKESNRADAALTENQGTNLNSANQRNGSPPNKQSEEARQAKLRERARKLIAEARAGMAGSPTSPDNRGGTVEVLTAAQALAEQQYYTSGLANSLDNSPVRSVKSESHTNSDSENNIVKKDGSPEHNGNITPSRQSFEGNVKSGSPLKSFAELMDRISPDKDSYITKGFGKDMNNYVQKEMEALEREQTAIDQQAAILEKELRAVMESGQSEAEENALMARWFTLVNKKNALLRRQMQLNILEQESELRQRHARVDGELRELLRVEEWSKSERQRGREARLLSELMTVVDARNQLVHHLHEHEQAIEDDDEIERNLSNVELQRKNQCSVQ